MEKIKQALSERCAMKGKTPIYIDKLHSIRDVFNNPVALSDVKVGRTYKMSFDALPMEKANVVMSKTIYPSYDDYPREKPYKKHWKEEAKHTEAKFLVTDVLHHNGMIFIEAPGVAYSTIDFPKEWNHVLENAESQKITMVIRRAMDETDRWLKDDSIKLAKEFGLWSDIASSKCRKEMLNIMVGAVAEYIDNNNPPAPYDKETIEAIQSVAQKAVRDRFAEMKHQENLALARELVDMKLPVVLCRDRLKPMEKHWRIHLEREEHIPDEKLIPFNLKTRLNIMAQSNADWIGTEYRFCNLVLRDVKSTDNGSQFYITDRMVFTNANIQKEYTQALKEAGYNVDSLKRGDLYPYMSMFADGFKNVFEGQDYLFTKAWPGSNKTDEQVMSESYTPVCERLCDLGIEPQFLPKSNSNGMAEIRHIDSNGVQHEISMKDVQPGMTIVIIDNRDEFAPDHASENGTMMVVHEVAQIGREDFAFVTDHGMFVTRQDFIDKYNEVAQARALENSEQTQENDIEGHDRG